MAKPGSDNKFIYGIRPKQLHICGLTHCMTKRVASLSDFNELSQQQQYALLHSDGVYVGKRKESGQTVILFQLYSFYVEVRYRVYRQEIDFLTLSDQMDILEPYIDQIQVRDLNSDEAGGM
jgi:hypothetical protein